MGSYAANIDRPFNLSQNYLSYNNSINFKFNELLEYKDIQVIVELDDKKILGIYDPSQQIAMSSSHQIDILNSRFISLEDYKNKNKVSLYLSDEIVPDYDEIMKVEQKYDCGNIIKVIYSQIFDKQYKILTNLYALDYNKIEKIYIDSNNIDTINAIEDHLRNNGFLNQHEKQEYKIIDALQYAFVEGGQYVKFVLIFLLLAFVIYTMIIMMYVSTLIKKMKVEYFSGIRYRDICIDSFFLALKSIVLGLATIVLVNLYLNINGFEIALGSKNVVSILILIILYTTVLYHINKSYLLKKVKRGGIK